MVNECQGEIVKALGADLRKSTLEGKKESSFGTCPHADTAVLPILFFPECLET